MLKFGAFNSLIVMTAILGFSQNIGATESPAQSPAQDPLSIRWRSQHLDSSPCSRGVGAADVHYNESGVFTFLGRIRASLSDGRVAVEPSLSSGDTTGPNTCRPNSLIVKAEDIERSVPEIDKFRVGQIVLSSGDGTPRSGVIKRLYLSRQNSAYFTLQNSTALVDFGDKLKDGTPKLVPFDDLNKLAIQESCTDPTSCLEAANRGVQMNTSSSDPKSSSASLLDDLKYFFLPPTWGTRESGAATAGTPPAAAK